MWSGRQGRLRPVGCVVEELRCRRREREAALRKARREQQLISKRLLRDDASEEAEGGCVAMILGETEIQHFLRLAQQGTEEKERERALVSLRRGLQHPETQQTFIWLEGSMRTLVGLLTSNQALLQLEAARCLHELSHSEQSAVAEACLPATSYLLTYLSGHSSDFIELCLYTLGNLIVESEAVRRQLLPQGIVPALAACIQSPHLTVLEALGYALSQLLQVKEAPEMIIPSVLGSTLPEHILRLLQPGPKLNLGVAVEFAWCLHYIICSQVDNTLLISHGGLSTLGLLLLDMAGAVQRTEDTGLELLACPVLRCLSNLLTEAAMEVVGGQNQLEDERVVAALFILLQFFLQKQPSLLPEGLWLLNNLTANSPSFCTSLLSMDLIEPLLQLLPVSNVVSILVLTVLCNVAEKGPAYCQRLWPGPLLSCLIGTLASPDIEVVGQSLELLQLLFLYQPEAAKDFLQQSGLQVLERHQEEAQLQDRVHALQQTALHQ
ncbi:transmembrane and coiled-coil domain-containing protein 6 isoform X3 [Panthera pardus]|uniref:Transmembrane and coiled-coil domain-containing protein 6 isoform X3 n=1 Tax=Panthera pardus TaxID=9691 RepID=A0A9V1EEU5_PANPR|nr:transmembrane and coiled-coil domain-containing protein 6 isoform X3 [Panthera pardus]XP_042793134.1 transmembrane and coiled-coil domain-containing protein 6 isoform X3 [Panthera leo]XP_060491937.1 transmembrane and coiled-coil domain-containing protein 6 isoform X2 [Panthera onca]